MQKAQSHRVDKQNTWGIGKTKEKEASSHCCSLKISLKQMETQEIHQKEREKISCTLPKGSLQQGRKG